MPNLLDKFKKFVSDCGYKLVVSDTGISVEELAGSPETGSEEHNEEKTNIIPK